MSRTSERTTARGNRLGLTLVGLVLLAVGGLALALGLGAFGRTVAAQPILTRQTAAFAQQQAWFWPAVAALAVIVALLGLRWLFTQVRLDRMRRMRLDSDPSGVTEMDSATVTNALAEEVGRYPQVRGAHAVLAGSPDRPRLRLNLQTEPDADLGALLNRVTDQALPHLRNALEVDRLPTVAKIDFTTAPGARQVR
ncbi:alkaline shock response membrane anchor protein AmaP [Rhizohabitans arisaemae]|uniref:alkaline shock response membrane anchor protein AmaP n=1 Tax=Rhizohabitans arisaemae TaxID=2720610 RepID=UPI0024B23D2E|nr:alkaline shock response membrane anchor protein AmaP [Rhizohabitans arisaemae]